MNLEIREALAECADESAAIFESPDFDDAIIGVTDDGRVVYNYELMVQSLVWHDGMTEEEAIEFIDYNTIRACAYFKNAPIIVYKLPL